MNKISALLYVLLAAAVTAFGFHLAAVDDSTNTLSLGALKPLTEALILAAKPIANNGAENLPYTVGLIVLVIALTGLGLSPAKRNLLAVGLAAGYLGQAVLVSTPFANLVSASTQQPLPDSQGVLLVSLISGGLYLLALSCFFLAFRKQDPMEAIAQGRARDSIFSLRDALALLGVTVIALFFRLYAINYVPDTFEGELAFFSAGGTSFDGMFLANKGARGPWAPLGLLYYVPIYITTSLFGTTLTALRMSSTLVGVFTIPFMYMFARRIGGKRLGLVAALLLALNFLHVGWGRTDIHPHGVTTWPSLLLCIVLLRAFGSRKVIDALWVALAMGLTWHQYPSGQSAVAIPVFAVGIYWLFNRFRFALRWPQLILVALGVGLWFIGLPLSYYYPEMQLSFDNPFNLTGPRALWGGDDAPQSAFGVFMMVVAKSADHFFDVVQGIFYRAFVLFHQDIMPVIPGFNVRTLAWPLVPLAMFGFFIVLRSIKRFESAVILAWMLAAILPGIMSESAYPKRLSSFYPALDLLAAMGLARYALWVSEGGNRWRRATLSVAVFAGFACFTAWSANAWFSGRPEFRYGRPYETVVAEEMAKEVQPKTIIITDLALGYHIGKMTYLMIDALAKPENRPNMWVARAPSQVMPQVVDPLRAGRFTDEDWPYMWTKLRDQKAETDAVQDWQRVVFMLQERTSGGDDNSPVVKAAMERCSNPTVRRIPNGRTFWLPLLIITCQVSDLK
jgi:4-amino-4-deoxy-L-arabinose transferase-like glycosyltransferase